MIPDRYTIPALVAAAAHAALFVFLPPRAPDQGPALPEPPLLVELRPPVRPVFELALSGQPPAEAGGGGGLPVPQLPEPDRVARPSDCRVPIPRLVPTMEVPHEGKRIPIEGPGPIRGVRGAEDTGHVIVPHLLDHEPRARVRVPPEYPHEMKRLGVEGEVEVAFVVAADGSVREAQVTRSSGREFEAAAVRAVLRWKFEPGRYRGRAVSFRMSVPLIFRLDAQP